MDRKNINVVFMGTPDFAKCSLEKLYDENFNILGVFTNQDKPSGRGMKMQMSPVKEFAISKNIPVYQPAKIRENEEVFQTIKDLNPDFLVVVAYGKILPEEILSIPKYGAINVHGSLLPKYRGAAPIQWAVINGEKITGITTMFMDKGMDTGDMLLKEEVEILDTDTSDTMFYKLAPIGANLLVKTLDEVYNGTLKGEKQTGEATYAPMIEREMTKLDFNKKADEIVNLIRGVGSIGTYMIDENENKYKVYKAQKYSEEISGNIGEVVLCDKKHLAIKCKENSIEILEIQAPNSKKMDIKSFLAGNKFEVGKKFI